MLVRVRVPLPLLHRQERRVDPSRRLRGFGFKKVSDDTWERCFPYQRDGRFSHHIGHLRVRQTQQGFTVLRCAHEYRSRKVTEHVLFRVTTSSGKLAEELQQLFTNYKIRGRKTS